MFLRKFVKKVKEGKNVPLFQWCVRNNMFKVLVIE